MKILLGTALALIPVVAQADQIGDWIDQLGKGRNEAARIGLIRGPYQVDGRIMALLERLITSNEEMHPSLVKGFVNILNHRKDSGKPGAVEDQGMRGAKIILRLAGMYGVDPGPYISGRGPAMYDYFLAMAKTNQPEKDYVILRLTELAMKTPKDKLGDPAMIRLFRREKKHSVLAHLNDRESIPTMRAALKGPERLAAAYGLARLGEDEGIRTLLPMLSEKAEVDLGPQYGQFGSAARTLRRYAKPKHADLVLDYAKRNSGYPRAFALNVLGYIGEAKHISSIKSFVNDTPPRVGLAAENAISRIEGNLPKKS